MFCSLAPDTVRCEIQGHERLMEMNHQVFSRRQNGKMLILLRFPEVHLQGILLLGPRYDFPRDQVL